MVVLSLFSGGGGSCMGYKNAGCEIHKAVEIYDYAVKCYKLNVGQTIIQADVKNFKAKDYITKNIDILDGSPPCQGFSIAGKRNNNDERSALVWDYIRIRNETKPKAFIFENVEGLLTMSIFPRIVNELSINYNIKAKIVDAAYYSVPQSRRRLFIIGIRKDFKKNPQFPEKQSNPILIKEALKGIIPEKIYPLTDKYGQLWDKIKPGKSAFSIIGAGSQGCQKLHPLRPSYTICKSLGNTGYSTIAHWDEPRAISINESLVIGGFPKDYKFPENNYKKNIGIIGNSCCPPVSEHIAKALIKTLNN